MLIQGQLTIELAIAAIAFICDSVSTPSLKKRNNTEEELATSSTGLNTDSERAIEHSSLFKHADRATVMLSMLKDNMKDVIWINNHLEKTDNLRQSLVEFSEILLPSFRSTLQMLQQMSRTLDLSFFKFIASVTQDSKVANISPLAYSRERDFVFSLNSLTEEESLKLKPEKQFDYQMLRSKFTLDDAQQIFTVNALSRCLALIQESSDIGKSYTGVAIIKTLLKNRKTANLDSIVCICYTNHALDQLLKHLVKNEVEQLIHLDSRSKFELLQDLNLRHVSQQVEQTKIEDYKKWQLHTKLNSELAHIEEILQELKNSTLWRNIKAYLKRQDSFRHFEQLFEMRFDEDEFRTVRDRKYSVVKSWLREAAQRLCSNRLVTKLSNVSLLKMSVSERESIHKYWVQQHAAQLNDLLLHVLEFYRDIKDELKKCYQKLNLRCLLRAHVIDVTITGLARNLEILRRVRAKVMMCEETDEILETHTLITLLPSVEHAILIENHEQLRLQINNYELQHDHLRSGKFSLNISLFERLVKSQPDYSKISFSSLKMQRRMHSSIAELVRTTLYFELQDYASMLDYFEVDELRKRLFWLNHQEKKDSSSSAQMISFSKTNSFEVEMIVALIFHLVRQETYEKDDIAVLTSYLKQLQKIKQRLRSSFEIVIDDRDLQNLKILSLKDDSSKATTESEVNMQKTILLNALRIATVDNFQREEAKVIVISLIRSNDERKCEFLKTLNRINVLLSRARHDMYIIDNAQIASSVLMWINVIFILERDKNIGQILTLCCSRHKKISIEISKVDDFSLLSLKSDCDKKCTSRLRCEHACINKCHVDSLHNVVRCLERCQRIKRDCEHSCLRLCEDSCKAKCSVQISNIVLPCEHIRKWLKCHKAQASKTVSCRIKVEIVMSNCKHRVKIRCCDLSLQNDYSCSVMCEVVLVCEHDCKHACKDCNSKIDDQIFQRAHDVCKTQCSRLYTTCSHACLSICHDDDSCSLCNESCEIRCSHSRCSKKCQEHCMSCVEDCSWSCSHREKCQMSCAMPCNLLPCSKRCSKILSCDHRCSSVCEKICSDVQHCQKCVDTSIKKMMIITSWDSAMLRLISTKALALYHHVITFSLWKAWMITWVSRIIILSLTNQMTQARLWG